MMLKIPSMRLRNVTGFALLIAGVLGLLLPVIPGIPLLIAGVTVLGPNHSTVRALVTRVEHCRSLVRRKKT